VTVVDASVFVDALVGARLHGDVARAHLRQVRFIRRRLVEAVHDSEVEIGRDERASDARAADQCRSPDHPQQAVLDVRHGASIEPTGHHSETQDDDAEGGHAATNQG